MYSARLVILILNTDGGKGDRAHDWRDSSANKKLNNLSTSWAPIYMFVNGTKFGHKAVIAQ